MEVDGGGRDLDLPWPSVLISESSACVHRWLFGATLELCVSVKSLVLYILWNTQATISYSYL